MKALNLLESKISALLGLVKGFRAENGKLKKECDQLKTQTGQLTEEKAKLDKKNAALGKEVEQLTKKLEAVEGSLLSNNKSVDVLNQEKEETRGLIDDLIKHIDSLVESEKQQ